MFFFFFTVELEEDIHKSIENNLQRDNLQMRFIFILGFILVCFFFLKKTPRSFPIRDNVDIVRLV